MEKKQSKTVPFSDNYRSGTKNLTKAQQRASKKLHGNNTVIAEK